VSCGFEESKSRDCSFLFKHEQQYVRISLIPETSNVIFSTIAKQGDTALPPADSTTLTELNAYLLYNGGGCLLNDPEKDEMYFCRGKNLRELRSDTINQDLVAFAAFAAMATEKLFSILKER
jgi:hypothetical protein